ncbi:MAG: isoaspartyl peptidase/L-asparaginase [Acetobacteraceae bacterium]|nr:isoaspartyl peptidase/L-asparaginase [Acetobacteraceae bacterium]
MAIIIHGGADENVDQTDPVAPNHVDAKLAALREIIRDAWAALYSGKPALDVVERTVVALEDNPAFNAGYGAAIGAEGVELDAGIMDGRTGKFGAVTGITVVKNPIIVAREILETPYNLYQGIGANALAQEVARRRGLKCISARALETAYQRAKWERWKTRRNENPVKSSDGTVGVVAFDGTAIAAGTSTGGMTGKPKGRVGDTPLLGAGTFASADAGASATGEGEKIMQLGLTRYAVESLQRHRLSPQEAAESAIAALGAIGGRGGIIIVDNTARVGACTNAPLMTCAFMTAWMSASKVEAKEAVKGRSTADQE